MKTLNKKAFTLIELIIVIAVAAILAVGIFVASKPQKRIGETNDAQRKNDAQALEQAIKMLAADSGVMPTELKTLTENQKFAIVKAGGEVSGTYTCAALNSDISKKDISTSLLSVIPAMPMDPELSSSSNETGYYIVRRGSSYDIEPCNTYELAATSGSKQMCGDGYCGSSESCSSCAQDCGACPGPQSYTVGPYYPLTAVDGGGYSAWISPTNALTENGSSASTQSASGEAPYDDTISLIKADGSIGSSNKAVVGAWPYPSPIYNSYGGSSDTWGETWTTADINDSDFGVAIKAHYGMGGVTNYLKLSNYNFDIPISATINGIKLDLKRSSGFNVRTEAGWGAVDTARITIYYTN